MQASYWERKLRINEKGGVTHFCVERPGREETGSDARDWRRGRCCEQADCAGVREGLGARQHGRSEP